MVQAGNSEIVANLRSAWNGSLVEQDAALAVWTSLVRTNAVWDFKLDIVQAGIRFGDDLITLGGHDLNFQVVANIFFGFVGRQIGMSENFLQFGAGVAQSEH